jgi:ankyrin repeat protein
MHWAAITNRASVIPVLKAAGVPINDLDGAGWTPLMYAAAIDFGEKSTYEALLSAGAEERPKPVR